MSWLDRVHRVMESADPFGMPHFTPRHLLPLIDLTRLNDEDSAEDLTTFFIKAERPFGAVQSVCVIPKFVSLAKAHFVDSSIKICTVANFPSGAMPLEDVLGSINQSLAAGADEIDVVFPYAKYLSRDKHYPRHFVESCKVACGSKALLKMILEIGALDNPYQIKEVSEIAVMGGADFIKTSTGKISQGATLEAAAVMLYVITRFTHELNRPIGLKISGGIREIAQAMQYVALVRCMMGEHFIKPATFRIGASQLVDAIQ